MHAAVAKDWTHMKTVKLKTIENENGLTNMDSDWSKNS